MELKLTPEEERMIREHREHAREVGYYWITPEGRQKIKDIWCNELTNIKMASSIPPVLLMVLEKTEKLVETAYFEGLIDGADTETEDDILWSLSETRRALIEQHAKLRI